MYLQLCLYSKKQLYDIRNNHRDNYVSLFEIDKTSFHDNIINLYILFVCFYLNINSDDFNFFQNDILTKNFSFNN